MMSFTWCVCAKIRGPTVLRANAKKYCLDKNIQHVNGDPDPSNPTQIKTR